MGAWPKAGAQGLGLSGALVPKPSEGGFGASLGRGKRWKSAQTLPRMWGPPANCLGVREKGRGSSFSPFAEANTPPVGG